MTQPMAHGSSLLSPAIPPTLEWPDLDPVAAEITRLSARSHTITWQIAIGHAFLALSWEQSASVEYRAAWRAWSCGLHKTASERHERARHTLTQAASCWSKVASALSRALSAKRQHTTEQHNPSYALDDLEQGRAFAALVTQQQDRVEARRLWLDRERLTTTIPGRTPTLHIAASSLPGAAESEASDEQS